MDELLFHINTNNPDILVLTEVAPKNNRYLLKKSELEIKGYSLYINNFEEKGVRGVAIYVKKNIATVQIYPRESAPDTAWVEIKASKNKKMIIGGIYRVQIIHVITMKNCGIQLLTWLAYIKITCY